MSSSDVLVADADDRTKLCTSSEGLNLFLKVSGLNFVDDEVQLEAHEKTKLTSFEKVIQGRRIACDMGKFLKHNGFQHQLADPKMVTSVCSSLLYVVSCDEDPLMVISASNALTYHIGNEAPFSPDPAQILDIAVRMGLSFAEFGEDWLPEETRSSINGNLQICPGINGDMPRVSHHSMSDGNGNAAKYRQPFQFKQVVRCLTELLWPGAGWSVSALDTLFVVLVAMLADKHMKEILMAPHVSRCLDRLLGMYEDAVWQQKVQDHAELLWRLPDAVKLLVLRGLPRRDRGLLLRRLAAYLCLQWTAVRIDLPGAVTVTDVWKVVSSELRASDSAANVEHVLCLVTLVDMAVGSEPLPGDQQSDLRKLLETLQRHTDAVTYDVELLEPQMELKRLMSWLKEKWEAMMEKSMKP